MRRRRRRRRHRDGAFTWCIVSRRLIYITRWRCWDSAREEERGEKEKRRRQRISLVMKLQSAWLFVFLTALVSNCHWLQRHQRETTPDEEAGWNKEGGWGRGHAARGNCNKQDDRQRLEHCVTQPKVEQSALEPLLSLACLCPTHSTSLSLSTFLTTAWCIAPVAQSGWKASAAASTGVAASLSPCRLRLNLRRWRSR